MLTATVWPASAQTQGIGFSSFDVGMGGVFVVDGDPGVSYSAAVDVANLLVRGAALRFGFRFWSSGSVAADGREVDLDDTTVSLTVKKRFWDGATSLYGALGVGFHFIAARFGDFIDEKEKRDGFHPGLDGVLGLELPVADRGFLSVFLEGQGSLLAEVSHASVHAGVRVRFDRLGSGG